MIFFKPAWLNHEDNKPIFSVDVHPNGNRFATGGQGGAGGRIVIWNVSPVIKESDESDPKVAKMLCQMDNHLACVNVVRWSNNGHFLASGGDDKLVMIWRLTSEVSSIFGSSKVNVETWKCVHTLNSHNGDVLDLAWAPHDGWIASGSVDNSVIVWNAHKFPEKLAVLKNHTGMVKGVAWDPVGKYLASQSDDKSLRIWRTSDWNQQETVLDPFEDCSATTHVLRCSWSPDGQYLVSAHAMNGGGPTAQIIEREGWKQDKDFVGHRKAVTCVRFNSNIFKKSRDSPKKSTQYCCCAIGSRDRSISVWLTSLKRPLVVIKDLFDDSVLDISWSSKGDFLLACSWDGTVACVMFEKAEVGVPLTMDEKNALYERVYHKSLQSSWNLNFSGSQIVEDPELLSAMEEINKKTEPVNVEVPPEIMVEPPKLQDVSFESPNLNQSILVPVNKQVETRLASGKRRITPMLLTTVPNCNAPMDSLSVLSSDSTQFFTQSQTFSKSSPQKSQIMVEKRTESQPPPVIAKEPKVTTRPQFRDSDTVISNPPGTAINQLMCVEVPGDEPITKFINIMDPLKVTTAPTVTKEAGTLKIQVSNNCHKISSGSALSKIEVRKNTEKKEPVWETFLGASIRTIASNRRFVIACCEDFTINVYDIKTGARILPPLLIDDLVSCMSLSQNGFLLLLTKTGLIYLWDLPGTRCVLSRVSIRSLLTGAATVSGCSLTTSNQPILTLNDGRAYSYSLDLQTWVQLSNPLDPVSRSATSLVKKVPNSQLPLASLQRVMPHYRPTDSTLPSGVTLSFLESQLTATNVLRSAAEYRHWLFAQVNHLLDKGPECRLKVILNDLLGPTHRNSKKPKLDGDIMGLSRRQLLEEILSVIKTKLPWQRLYKEYSEQLKEVSDKT